MNEVVRWIKGRLSEPSTYAAASVAAMGGWVWTTQISWVWVALALAAMIFNGSRSFVNKGLLATGHGSFGSGCYCRETFFQC